MYDIYTAGVEYEEVCLMPAFPGSEHPSLKYNMACSALNAVAIATGVKWEELVKSLIEQSHNRCRMPMYKSCVTDMLKANGFNSQRGFNLSVTETLKNLNREFSVNKRYVAKFGNGCYVALVPDAQKQQYVLKGALYKGSVPIERRWLDELWVYIPGSDNRKRIMRSHVRALPEAKNGFIPMNLNPESIGTDDCVIRALSAVLNCSWHEALDITANASGYKNPIVNMTENVNFTLQTLGFEPQKGLKHGNSYYNGIEMCEYFNRHYSNEEMRVFTFVGRNHCACILPFREDGKLVYKVQDSWNSSDKPITEFWIKREKSSKGVSVQGDVSCDEFPLGAVVKHSRFGEGKVVGCYGDSNNRFIEIDFGASVGKKKISEVWLRKDRINS